MCAPVADRRAVTFAPAALGDALTCAAVSGAVAIGARAAVCASVHLQRSVACAPVAVRRPCWGLRGVRLGEASHPGPGARASQGNDLRLRHHAADVKSKRTRDLRRGPQAWTRAASAEPRLQEDSAERLLVHSVADSTALRIYLPNVRKFLGWLQASDVAFVTMEDKDHAMSRYLSIKCYDEDVGPAAGDAALNGLMYLFPEYRGEMPRSWRCLLGWHRVHIHGEGSPLPIELIACIAEAMRKAAQPDAADAVELATDCYLRSMELLALRATDVVILEEKGARQAVVRLGAAERGESAKTGMRQGVRVDSPHVIDMLVQRKAKCQPNDLLSGLTKARFVTAWHAAGLSLKFDLGPPHSLRHSGPSHDAATGYRTMWQIQRRGRWASERSVLRYAKTHAWVEARAKVPAALMQRGALLLDQRQDRAEVALE